MKIKTIRKLFPITIDQNGENDVLGHVVTFGFQYGFFPKLMGHELLAMEITFDCNWGINEITKYDL